MAGSRAPRQGCLFCGGRPLTREHGVPEWLLRAIGFLYGERGKGKYRERGTIELWSGDAETPRSWPGAKILVKNFCEPCNSGWMSDLEGLTKPLITPFLRDLSVPLNRTNQQNLARWSIKTAIVLERVGSKSRASVFTAADRALIREGGIPSLAFIWIGRHNASNRLFGAARRLVTPELLDGAPHGEPSPVSEGYVTTLGLGRVVLQVLRVVRNPNSSAKKATLQPQPGPWSQSLLQIWPRRRDEVRWPPASSFSDRGVTLDALSRRFLTEPRGRLVTL